MRFLKNERRSTDGPSDFKETGKRQGPELPVKSIEGSHMPTRSTLGQVGQLRQTGQRVKGGTGGQGGVGQGIDEEKQEDGEEEKDHLSAAEHFDQHPSISPQLHAFTFYSRQASFTLLVLLNFNNNLVRSLVVTVN